MTSRNPKRRSTFHKFLCDKLGGQISPELLPRRVRILGHVAILWIDPQVVEQKREIGQAVLEFSPKIRSVLRRVAAISGPYRQPALELIAGSRNTETSLRENQVLYYLDPMKVMFSLGNKAERLRMSKISRHEFIVDMFAGIGQFTLPLAVHTSPEILHAIEWNPDAFYYLQKNIEANRVADVVTAHYGDTGEITPQVAQARADRVLMGLIQGTIRYLDQGINALRSGGILHFHEVGFRFSHSSTLNTINQAAERLGRKAEFLFERKIKSYNPQLDHYVVDVQIH